MPYGSNKKNEKMKKIILLSLTTLVFASCKKESMIAVNSTNPQLEIAKIVERADAELFHKMYEQKLPVGPIVKYVPGLFVWNGSPGGTMSCDRTVSTICMIEVIFPKMVIQGETGSVQAVTAIDDVFTENEEGYVVLNEIAAPLSKKVNSVKTTSLNENNTLINYTE